MSEEWVTSTTLLDGIRDRENKNAWSEFLIRYEPIIRGYVLRIGTPRELVDDIVQETLLTFVKAYRRGDYDRTKGRLRSWVCTIAVSRAVDMRRKLRRAGVQLTTDEEGEDYFERLPAVYEAAFEAEWQKAVVNECLRQVEADFSDDALRIFRMVVLEEVPVETVSAAFGVTRAVIYTTKSRVLAKIREIKDRIELDY